MEYENKRPEEPISLMPYYELVPRVDGMLKELGLMIDGYGKDSVAVTKKFDSLTKANSWLVWEGSSYTRPNPHLGKSLRIDELDFHYTHGVSDLDFTARLLGYLYEYQEKKLAKKEEA